jgi:hypothetical protein
MEPNTKLSGQYTKPEIGLPLIRLHTFEEATDAGPGKYFSSPRIALQLKRSPTWRSGSFPGGFRILFRTNSVISVSN